MREASGVAQGLTSLPSGGGGIAPLGERFQPDLVKGSGSYAVPINLPKGPNDFRPTLSLTYSTGAGNGVFGMGWRFTSMRIERRTDRGIPTYTDADTFVIGDAEVLVPVGDNRYRSKTDTQFWFIERVDEGWRIRTGDGRTLLLGQNAASREEDGGRVFAWHLDEERDAAGNSIQYTYLRSGRRLLLADVRYSIFRVHIEYEPRPDVLCSGVAGFERRTLLRARSIELHCDRLAPTLMREYDIAYTQALNGASLLQRITLTGREGNDEARFPALDFSYSSLDPSAWRVHEIEATIAPPSLGDAAAQLVDLTGDGLPDVLQSTGSRMYLWRNAGAGRLEGPTVIQGMPSTVALDRANVALADLDGDGRVDLFAVDQPLQLAFEATARGGFQPEPLVFRNRPNVRLAASDTRLMDIDNDGVTDIISTGARNLLLYRHAAGIGFEEPEAVARISDLEQFPDVRFGDRGVRLADMSGDGLQDFVVVESGNVGYWPHLGYGRWGARVQMQSPPRFPEGYRDDRVLLADVDGDGCTDIVYADYDRTLIWINQAGGGFSAPTEIPIGMGTATSRILPCDFLGDGRIGFAWSAAATRADSAGYRFLRIDQGRKPYLMTRIDNGMGGEYLMEYSTSTTMRLEDRSDGADWSTELPFVVHVVRDIVEKDNVAGRTTRLSMRYHDGVYDGQQREFRGFSRVSVDNAGDDSVPTTRQELEFFQGDPDLVDLVERDRQRALAGSIRRTRTFEQVGADYVLRTESAQTWDARLEFSSPAGTVHFPFVRAIETRETGSGGSPARIERTRFVDYDAHGNAARRLRESFGEGEPESAWIRSEERYTYTTNTAAWLIKLPVRLELRDATGTPLAIRINHYDGPPLAGLPEGEAASGLLSRVEELKLLESRLPADYIGGRDVDVWGLTLQGDGETRGYYANPLAYRRDARGNIIDQRDASAATTTLVYDADGVYPVTSTDPRGAVTQFVFSPKSGEPSTITLDGGRRIRYEYDPLGRLAASHETDAAGSEQLTKVWITRVASTPTSITSIAPVEGGRSRAELVAADPGTLAEASVSRIYYDGFGKELLEVATAPEQPGTPRFVARKRAVLNPRALVRAQHAERFVASIDYTASPPLGDASVRTRYDAQGNLAETAGPGPEHYRVVRDSFTITHFEGAAAGAFGSEIPPGPPSRVERFDARGRLMRIEEAKGDGSSIATGYELTLDGKIAAVRDNDGKESTRYSYAAAGEPIRITNRDAGTRTYYRDASGRTRERVDADGSRLHYQYDAVGRLTRIEHQATGTAVRRTLREVFYDADPFQNSTGRFLEGRIAVVREGGAEIRFSYNPAGKAVREEVTVSGVTLVTSREYDLQGRMTATTYPDGRRVVYDLGANGTVKQIVGIANEVRYAADGNLEAYRLANGVNVAMPRDSVSRRLNEVSATLGGSVLRRLQYGYDTTGNIASILDEMPASVEHHAFKYDGLHRLASFAVHQNTAAGTLLKAGAYEYDTAGNILRHEEGQPLTLAYADAARPSRLTSIASAASVRPVAYTTLGQMQTFGDLATIEYDPLERISHVIKTDGTEIRFAYDPQSRRLLKEVTTGGTTTRVHYATGLYERHASHALRHIYLGTMMVATEKVVSGPPETVTTAFYLSDHHGTILMAADAAGVVIHNQRYSPFGSALNPAVELDRYLARERDIETGLLHLGARYYAPVIGRFVSPDWWVLENPTKPARMPQGFNVYSYALNNPLVFKDPSGMWFGIDDLIVAAVGFVVGFVTGLVYGLVNGQGWGSLLTALETGLTTAAGAWLGWTVAGPFGAVMGGMNGLISGIHGIYDWGSVDGWFAFLSDSTWGLIGTTLGNVVHVINLFGNTGYREDLSRRQNRHVYEGGFYLKEGFTFTQGNVISNAGQNGSGINASFIANHEELHVWQQRFFGPLFQITYVVWGIGGFIVGSVVWLTDTNQNWGSLVETAAYYDNPFEYWAYKNDSNWPPSGANPTLRWA
jgi:RHS repeat-associated protein